MIEWIYCFGVIADEYHFVHLPWYSGFQITTLLLKPVSSLELHRAPVTISIVQINFDS